MIGTPNPQNKFRLMLLALLLLLLGSFIAYKSLLVKPPPQVQIQSFEECAAAGYPIMESYPEQCRTPDGVTFVRQITDQQVTITGEVVCLPHKDRTGPQTMECAFGMKADDGSHYGLRDPEMRYVMALPSGKRVTVTGVLHDNEPATIYDTVGVIEITSVTE